jgi:hypothetical protein
MLELRVKDYDQLRNKCDSTSREYRILINCCVDPWPDDLRVGNVIRILCETGQAVELPPSVGARIETRLL